MPRHTEYCVENNEIHAVFLVVLVKNDKNHSFMAEFWIHRREKRRFLEQADCLIIASDMPSAEINNAARFARLHSKPIIDLNTADMHFRR